MQDDPDSCIHHRLCNDSSCNGFGEKSSQIGDQIEKYSCLKYLPQVSAWRSDLMIPEYIESRRQKHAKK